MAREPAITFRGALRILGHYDRPWLDRLDGLLGGVILASVAAPPVSAVWGWVDQKNEATGLLRRALDAVSTRLTNTGGLARHELVIAAHTILVLSAFFEAVSDEFDGEFEAAALTDAEKVRLGTGEWQRVSEPLVRCLYAANVPAPSAMRGFEENVRAVEDWARSTMRAVSEFLKSLEKYSRIGGGWNGSDVGRRYRSDYLRLVTAVPEFRVWADLGEHAATRTALARLEDLLTQPESVPRDLRALVNEINRAELSRPVIDVDIDGYGIDAVFPSVERIFLTPRFRATSAERSARIGDEHWWEDLPVRQDLDVVLARHFSTPDSTARPLLLLGHPGAGKSLLMKVLAARLPSAYTVVRVRLRRVDANANVSTQIQQALSAASNGRVSWPELVDQSDDAIRVLLLDGLDELLQAAANRAGYLTDILEFQRVEAAMGKPVAVVVTSRTLVADRVRIPDGTPVLKLEEFDEDQIQEWLRIWNEVNPEQSVTFESVMAQDELARQPLLLLLLTLYFADPEAVTDTNLSTLELYQRLFDTYAHREVTKQAGRVLPAAELTKAIHTQLSRLSIGAMGMFNRGRQSIAEAELSTDLAALGERVPAGGFLLGEFFFVHASEAMTGEVQRGYEFLHATFGEYLVAAKVVETLLDVAEAAYGRRRFHDPDDDLLFALLSHQPLAVQRSTVDFIANYFEAMEYKARTDVIQTLELLVHAYRGRRTMIRYPDYRPLPQDMVRVLAAYSANLVLLRVLADWAEEVDLSPMWSGDAAAWPATVNLWAAGLDTEGYRAMLAIMERNAGAIVLMSESFGYSPEFDGVRAAHLRGDSGTLRRLWLGHAALDEWAFRDREPGTWMDRTLSSLLGLLIGYADRVDMEDPPVSVSGETTLIIAEIAIGVFGLRCADLDREDVGYFLRWLMRLRVSDRPPALPLALVERNYPGLLDELRADPDESRALAWEILLRASTPEKLRELNVTGVVDYLGLIVSRCRRLSRAWG